jgi:uncharacterized lipoprotein YddW (UPF0748 family)
MPLVVRPWISWSMMVSVALAGVAVPVAWAASLSYGPSAAVPPEPMREFRAMWIATVNNIDWPSKPGLTPNQQQAELLAIFDRAAQLRFNAVIFQVRPSCDALYASRYEPWSEYLTGQMGRAPTPFYDPLAFAVKAAHDRGLELHAWFNPFRARHNTGKSPIAPDHISRTQPHLVRTYGSQLWLDPGDKAAQDHALRVILDVIRCYDIDGMHMDDYFYPYPEKNAANNVIDFPDGPTWSKYVAAGGKLSRADWRRDNIDRFVQRLYQAVKAERRRVKVGLSPFGIWRPGYPPQVKKAFDAYAVLYADSRKWLEQGWLDYLAPQLYWPIESRETSFPVLLKWWSEQNPKGRPIWPGGSLYAVAPERQAAETVKQIRYTRQTPGVSGYIHWSARCLLQNRGGLVPALTSQSYNQPALVPAFPWLDQKPPGKPTLHVANERGAGLKLTWSGTTADSAWLWLLQIETDGSWESQVLPNRQTFLNLPSGSRPAVIAIRGVDRCGNLSEPTVLEQGARQERKPAQKPAAIPASGTGKKKRKR